LKGVRSGKLVNRNDGAGLAIQPTDRAVILLAQFDSGNVFHAHDPAIRSFANNDAGEVLRRCQTPCAAVQVFAKLPNGGIVRVKDVARVELGQQDYSTISRLNGKPSAIIAFTSFPDLTPSNRRRVSASSWPG